MPSKELALEREVAGAQTNLRWTRSQLVKLDAGMLTRQRVNASFPPERHSDRQQQEYSFEFAFPQRFAASCSILHKIGEFVPGF
jgi:hypothetical protein